MNIQPITLRNANDFVAEHHRHNGRTSRNGGKFAVSLEHDGDVVGVAIVGLPIARNLNDGWTGEVLRVCVLPDVKNGCSMLYQACWRAWRGMGGRRLITYTLETESGASLRGAGWKVVAQCKPGTWDRDKRSREYQPIYGQQKLRWETTTSRKAKGGEG